VKLCVGAIKLRLNVWVSFGDAEDFREEAGEISECANIVFYNLGAD